MTGDWIIPLATEKGANHLFIGGAPNQGKSALITNVLAEAAAMVDAQVWLADPKRVDYAAWRNVVARYANTVEAIEALVRDLGAVAELDEDPAHLDGALHRGDDDADRVAQLVDGGLVLGADHLNLPAPWSGL